MKVLALIALLGTPSCSVGIFNGVQMSKIAKYQGRFFGVKTVAHIDTNRRVTISVNGLGISHTGTAEIQNDCSLSFDEGFEEFFRRKRVQITSLFDMNDSKMIVKLKIPLAGEVTVHLYREVCP
tara:strand:- start:106 stop:477 length:372 start_codon:yes stop_codon:yes gene_type:complete